MGHVVWIGDILAFAVSPQMRGNAFAAVINLYALFIVLELDVFADQAVGDTVIALLNIHMVINVHLGCLPVKNTEPYRRQRPELGLLQL